MALLAGAVYLVFPLPDADWYGTYDPAVKNILAGKSPYDVPGFHNPPWMVLLLLPFGLFPLHVGRALFFIASILIFIFILWKTESNALTAVAVFLSPTLLGGLLASNPDLFILSGILLSPTWGLLVLLLKPQIGMGLFFYYLYWSWKDGGLKNSLIIFAPVVIGYLVSLALFPALISKLLHKSAIDPWNRSIFPYGIPLGIFFLWLAIRKKNPYLALAVGPFFSPYLTYYSYLAVQIALLHKDVEKVIRRDLLQFILTVILWSIMLTFRL
jgi:hypothetical protein